MIEIAAFAWIAVALLLLLVWFLRERPKPAKALRGTEALAIEALFPQHCRYFPQIRQALSAADDRFLKTRVPADARRATLVERRQVARQFLIGLRQDFLRLHGLARKIAALSPAVKRAEEWERMKLGARFWVLYTLVSLRLVVGNVPLPQLERLASLVGTLAAQIDRSMAALEAFPASRLNSSLSA